MSESENSEIIKNLEDFEVLKAIVEGRTKIEDVDIDLKKRLIVMCNQRLQKINDKIKIKELEIDNGRKLLDFFQNLL